MATLGIVGSGVVAQVRERPQDLNNVEVVATAASADHLLRALEGRHVDALLLELESLGDEAGEAVKRLQERTGAQVAIVTYEFARKQDVNRLSAQGENIRMMRKPVNLAMLQISLMGVIVRDIFKGSTLGRVPTPPSPVVTAATSTMTTTTAPAPARNVAGNGVAVTPRFTREQLGRLQEMSSTIKCECPNHVASLVTSLLAFEDYARACENRNAADAAMHRMLHDKTAAARMVMEDALAELVAFEKMLL